MFGKRFYGNAYFGPAYWGNGAVAFIPATDVDDPGTSEAAAIAAIEGDGLVAAVLTAYSSTIPAGEVISQDPAAGTLVAPGSTVTITVSLGAPATDEGSGGPDRKREEEFWYWLEKARAELKRQAERQREIAEEVREVPEEARETATLIRKSEEGVVRKQVLADLQRYVDTAPVTPSDRLNELIREAAQHRSRESLSRLQRALAKTAEDEEAIVFALLMMD